MYWRNHTVWIAVFVALLVGPLSMAEAATHVEVSVDQLNIRSEPGTASQIIETTTKATRHPILAEKDGWIQVKLANGKTGWVIAKYVKRIEIPQQKYVKSNVEQLNIRAEPHAKSQILRVIGPDDVYLQLKKQGDWAQLKLSEGTIGWGHARYLTETSAPAAAPLPGPTQSPEPPSTAPPSSSPVTIPPPLVPGYEHAVGTIALYDLHDVYAGPSFEQGVVGQIPGGATIPHYGYQDGWYLIIFNNTTGYIFKPDVQPGEYVQPPDIPDFYTPDSGQADKSIRVRNSDTNLRSGPGTDYAVVGKVQPGQVYPVVKTEGSWYLIRLADNSTAYIASWIVDLIQPGAGSDGPPGYNAGMVGNEIVYIYHTHNRESWRNVASNKVGSSVDDHVVNVTLVGKRLGETLQAKGIQTMVNQDDFAQRLVEQKKSYSLSYEESYKAVSAAVHTNPHLRYIFDIHRDGDLPRSDVAITLNGKTYARILFVIGTANPNYLENQKVADSLHARMEAMYPGLSRGIILKSASNGNGNYNQSVSAQSVLLEIGGTNSTLEESYNTAEALAEVLASF